MPELPNPEVTTNLNDLPSERSAAFAKLFSTWENYAQGDPKEAILTRDGGHKWADADEFYLTGPDDVERLLGAPLSGYDERGEPYDNRVERALDFGCGIGRLTFPLLGYAKQVIGMDISPTMLEHARKYIVPPASFVLCGEILPAFAQGFDLIISYLVFQHAPWSVVSRQLHYLAGLLNPGGRFVFQAPVGLERACISPPDKQLMEMHPIKPGLIELQMAESGLQLVSVRYCGSTVPLRDYIYEFQRPVN